uniref:Homing endonuclease LAGLIDADG domain-containing protein n=1 Tax=Chaetophoropsis polyrhiza TaxID=2079440 RepID=A0A6H1U5S2_9CHLO|nr:hypothetical protein [Chaetophoropsis polyrhiza]QIZ74248.1 hypothetical protein [Chaetophoropsis polyrhiza]
MIQPGEKIPQEVLEQLQEANKRFSKHKKFQLYLQDLRNIFKITPVAVSTESKLYLAGFIGGEGLLNVSAKKQDSAAMGLVLDPEFSITQHMNGVGTLYLALEVFQTGRLSYKAQSNATLVFRIDNRQSLQEKVLPYIRNYVFPYCSEALKIRVVQFQNLLNLFDQKAHLRFDSFTNEILPIWHAMRKQIGQSNQTLPDLISAQNYVRDFLKKKNNFKS